MSRSSIRPESDGVQTEHASSNPAPSPSQQAQRDAAYYDSDARDTKVPVLGLINKVGPLSDLFPKNAGEFAYNKRVVLGAPYTGPGSQKDEFGLAVIPLRFEKSFVETYRDGEEIKFGAKIEPPQKVFATAEAAYAQGYIADFDAPKFNNVEEKGDLVFLVAGPADDAEDAFFLEIGGLFFTPASFSVRRAAYRDVFQNIKTWSARPGSKVHNKLCLLRSKKKSKVRNGVPSSWYESSISATRKLTEAEIATIEAAVPAYLMPATPALPLELTAGSVHPELQ